MPWGPSAGRGQRCHTGHQPCSQTPAAGLLGWGTVCWAREGLLGAPGSEWRVWRRSDQPLRQRAVVRGGAFAVGLTGFLPPAWRGGLACQVVRTAGLWAPAGKTDRRGTCSLTNGGRSVGKPHANPLVKAALGKRGRPARRRAISGFSPVAVPHPFLPTPTPPGAGNSLPPF